MRKVVEVSSDCNFTYLFKTLSSQSAKHLPVFSPCRSTDETLYESRTLDLQLETDQKFYALIVLEIMFIEIQHVIIFSEIQIFKYNLGYKYQTTCIIIVCEVSLSIECRLYELFNWSSTRSNLHVHCTYTFEIV